MKTCADCRNMRTIPTYNLKTGKKIKGAERGTAKCVQAKIIKEDGQPRVFKHLYSRLNRKKMWYKIAENCDCFESME